jgi:hypothetical protein
METIKPGNLALTVLFALVFFSPSVLSAAAPKNLGLIPSTTIWYSQDPFYTGDRIRIYTAVYNNSQYDLTGTVEFFDNKTLIGKSDFSLAKGGGLRDVWTDWTVTRGSHRISAKISNAKISLPGQEVQDLAFEESTQESSITVEDPPKSVVEEKTEQEAQVFSSQ